jgi:hypothetical protein
MMNMPGKIYSVFRELVAPAPASFSNRRRSRRILIRSIIAGIIFAVVFGMVLYHMNDSGRFYKK